MAEQAVEQGTSQQGGLQKSLKILCIIAVFVLMALNTDLRTQLLLTLVSVGVVLLAYVLRSRFGARAPSRTGEPASGESAR